MTQEELMKKAEDLFREEFANTRCFIDYDSAGLEVIKASMVKFATEINITK